MHKIYYYSYDFPEKKDWLRQSMEALSQCLSQPPAEIEYEFSELPVECESDVADILNADKDTLHCYEASLLEYFCDKQGRTSSLLATCSDDSPFKRKALELNPNALWGIATYSFSAVYALYDQYIVWHEILHLLGTDDCYNIEKGNRGPNCELTNCIMQFEALERNVGNWPFLCDSNIQKVKARLGRWRTAKKEA